MVKGASFLNFNKNVESEKKFSLSSKIAIDYVGPCCSHRESRTNLPKLDRDLGFCLNF